MFVDGLEREAQDAQTQVDRLVLISTHAWLIKSWLHLLGDLLSDRLHCLLNLVGEFLTVDVVLPDLVQDEAGYDAGLNVAQAVVLELWLHQHLQYLLATKRAKK